MYSSLDTTCQVGYTHAIGAFLEESMGKVSYRRDEVVLRGAEGTCVRSSHPYIIFQAVIRIRIDGLEYKVGKLHPDS